MYERVQNLTNIPFTP